MLQKRNISDYVAFISEEFTLPHPLIPNSYKQKKNKSL